MTSHRNSINSQCKTFRKQAKMPANVAAGTEMIGHALVADGMACNGKEQIGNGSHQDRSKSSGSLPQICTKKGGDLKK